MSWQKIAVIAIILISLALGIFFYDRLPEEMASHWNASGEVNGYTEKALGTFLIPGLLAFFAILYYLVPKIDPLGKNIDKFREHYENFFVIISLFLLMVYAQVLLWNTGTMISPNILMPVGIAFLFFYIGILLENAKMNWFVGIRTPWTLSSEKVWDKTHKLGGKLFKVAAAFSVIGIFAGNFAVWFILIPVLLVSAYLILYSYLEFRKLTK